MASSLLLGGVVAIERTSSGAVATTSASEVNPYLVGSVAKPPRLAYCRVALVYDPAGAPYDLGPALLWVSQELSSVLGADAVSLAPAPGATGEEVVPVQIGWESSLSHPAVGTAAGLGSPSSRNGRIVSGKAQLAIDVAGPIDQPWGQRQVLLHEVLHALGLAHRDDDPDSIMRPGPRPGRSEGMAPVDRVALGRIVAASTCPDHEH